MSSVGEPQKELVCVLTHGVTKSLTSLKTASVLPKEPETVHQGQAGMTASLAFCYGGALWQFVETPQSPF